MRISRFLAFLTVILSASFITATAEAVPCNRVFLATGGNDAGVCANPVTPCSTFAGAMAQVQPGGEVIALSTGGFGPIPTITQSVTISAAPGVVAFTGYRVTVNAPGAIVALRGLTIDLTGSSAGGSGIYAQAFSVLHIEGCFVSGSTLGSAGIEIDSPGAVFISDTVVRNNASYGVILGALTGSLDAVIDRCTVTENGETAFLIWKDGHVTIRDTVSSESFEGVEAFANGTTIDVTLENCTFSNNWFAGVTAANSSPTPGSATVRASNCTITNNGTGLLNNQDGTLLSRGNNTVEGNGIDGTFSGTFLAK